MNKICSIILALLLFFSVSLVPFYSYADTNDNENSIDQNDYTMIESVEQTQLRITAASTTGLQSLILSLIGDYEPIVKDYTYTTTSYNGTQTTNHSIEIEPDWSWIASAAIFLVVIWCTFRFLGGLISGR